MFASNDFNLVFSAAHQQRLSSATQYATWQKHVRSLDLYNEFTRLQQEAVKKEPALVTFLEKSGLSPARGDYRTLVNEHLCATLHIESVNVLQNTTQAAKGIRALVDHFGDGILVMLPATPMWRLQDKITCCRRNTSYGNFKVCREANIRREETVRREQISIVGKCPI
jgi:hypothetical protein